MWQRSKNTTQARARGTRGKIFTQRVIAPPPESVIHTAVDALAVTLNEVGAVDLDRVAELRGSDVNSVLEELGAAVYHDPIANEWQTDDAYLSGSVRTKLQQAIAAESLNPAYARNVAALQDVQPPDLKPSEITARLGVPWIPPSDVMLFVLEVMGVRGPDRPCARHRVLVGPIATVRQRQRAIRLGHTAAPRRIAA